MRLLSILFCSLTLLGSFPGQQVRAAVVTQTYTFNDSQTGTGSGTLVHANLDGLIADLDPFNSALGTLNSFSIVWTASVVAEGTTGATSGNISMGFGGAFRVGSASYNGTGDGNSNGAGPGSTIPQITISINNTSVFLPSNAGVTYDPAILALITGSNPVQLSYASKSSNTAYTTFNDVATVSSVLSGTVTLTYDYTPAAVPEPTSMLIGGSLFAGVIGMRRMRKRS
jgi:hypothetical protein